MQFLLVVFRVFCVVPFVGVSVVHFAPAGKILVHSEVEVHTVYQMYLKNCQSCSYTVPQHISDGIACLYLVYVPKLRILFLRNILIRCSLSRVSASRTQAGTQTKCKDSVNEFSHSHEDFPKICAHIEC